jgi:ABC-type branched-subunit amino acid transport system substrate-binding protein
VVTATVSADEILIGGALSLTGVQASLDEPGLRGAQVAVKALNDAGGLLGKKVKFVNIDGKSDPVTVGNVAVELLGQGAELIIAPCDFDFGGPASREAQSAGIVGISTCASDPLYSSWSLGDLQFTLSMWNTTMGAAGAEYAYNEKGWKTAYVVTDQFIAYTKSLAKYFVEHFQAIGGKILLEDTYTNGDNDFSAQLARLKALGEKPDVIYISSYGTDIAMMIRTLREAGIDSPVMGGDAYDDPALFEVLGEKYGPESGQILFRYRSTNCVFRIDKVTKADLAALAEHHIRIPSIESILVFHPINQFAIGNSCSIFQGSGASDSHNKIVRLKPRPLDGVALDQVYCDCRSGWVLYGHTTDLTVTLTGMGITDKQTATWRTDRKISNCSRTHIRKVHIAAMIVWRE